MPYSTDKTILSAVSVTTTSAGVAIGEYSRLSIQFILTSATAGIAKAQVFVNNTELDGQWKVYNRLISNNAAGTATTTANLDSTTTNANQIYFFPVGDVFKRIRVQFNKNNSDGTFSAVLWSSTPGQ